MEEFNGQKNIDQNSIDKKEENNKNIEQIPKNSQINIQKLITLLNIMSLEFPLNNFAEKIEFETDGKFSFKELYNIIDKYYKKLSKNEKKTFIKYIPLSLLGVTLETPYLTSYSIFNYFSNLLEKKIYSPSLILYEISNKIKILYKQSTLQFFISNNIPASGEINLEDLSNLFSKNLNINKSISSIFFKIIDYNKKNQIKIEDIILAIDSFREDNYIIMDEKDKSLLFLNIIIEKNFININKIINENDNNYINYEELKNRLIKEISKKNKLEIEENILNNILFNLSKDEKIYKEEFLKILSEVKSKFKKKKIHLNFTQKYWINKYIDILSSLGISPKNEFKLVLGENNSYQIEIKEIKNHLLKSVSKGKINIKDLDNAIKSFDINFNGFISYSQYDECINQVLKNKQDLKNLQDNEQNFKIEDDTNNNMWISGIKPYNYYLLPIKGNYAALDKLNKNIKELISDFNKIKKTEIKIEKSQKNFRTISSELTNFNRGLSIMNNEEYNDEYYLKLALENFNFTNNNFPSFDLINHLIEKEDFSNNYSYEIIKYLDEDNDGYINIIDLIKFLLHELKYRSTKLVYKYLYIKIYKELNFSSSEAFFKSYNFKISNAIDIQKLTKFFQDLNIEFPLTKKILEDIKRLNKSPLIYEYICDMIDEYKNDSNINNLFFEKNEKNIVYNCCKFEQEIKNKINFLKNKDYKNDNLKQHKFKTELYEVIEDCQEIMNFSEYKKSFADKINLNEYFSLILFQLLKTFSKKGEQQISKNDLLMFFESYSIDNNINLNNSKKVKTKDIQKIIKKIKYLGAPLKYALEIIPFRRNGIISSSELIIYLNDFYNGSISKNELINIVFFIDINRAGIISYEQLQLFLNNYYREFSLKIELQIIVCNIFKDNYNNAESYFNTKFSDITKSKSLIDINYHNILLNKLCSNDKNLNNLFNYLAKNGKNYYLENLIDLLNGYFELDINYKVYNYEEINEDIFPDKNTIEGIIKDSNLGEKGLLSINEFIMKFNKNYRKKLLEKLDKEKKGVITLPHFIKICIEIYGTDIDLNYKLCAQYLYKKYIKSPNKIQKFLLDKTKSINIHSYISYEKTYNNFMFAFCNNKLLFETFYLIYKEKKGKNINMMNLKSIEQFIIINNKIDLNKIGNKSNRTVKDILHNKFITIKNIINQINVIQSGLNKNCLIKEKYFKTMLQTKFNFIDKDINYICRLFKNEEEEKFNLKKFFLYENEDIKKYNIIVNDEILPTIKNEIKKSNYNSYKQYKSKIFNNIDYLDIFELYSKFNSLYGISLYNCLLLMKSEQFFSTEKFFLENNLKNEFQYQDYDPSLKLAFSRLNEFFKKNTDKIKVFKEFDLDKNGKLSSEEFIISLNSLPNLNLNDSQKFKILDFIDINKDGKIDIQEFIKFINNIKNNINENGEITSSIPLIRKKINIKENEIENNNLAERNIIKNNINYNKNILKKNQDNDFLNYIIILQEDILKNENESLEKEFFKEDPFNKGFISENKFKIILKQKLLNIKGGNIEKFINLANSELKEGHNKENETKIIYYHNFLKNLSEYRFDKKKNMISNQNNKINLPKIN